MSAHRKAPTKHHPRAKAHHDADAGPPPPPKPLGPGELTRAFLADHGLDAKPRAALGDKGGALVDLARDQATAFLDRFVAWLLADYDVTYKAGHEPDDDADGEKADTTDDEKD